MTETAQQARLPAYHFEDLPIFTHAEVKLWNWWCAIAPSPEEWSSSIGDVLGHLVQRLDGIQVKLTQTHALEANSGEKILSFGSKRELFIGREAENDVVLASKAISKRHARLIAAHNHVCLEDLGGKLGTYLWDKRLPNDLPQVLRDGDQFSIFPYRFRVILERSWSPEKEVALGKCRTHPLQRGSFLSTSPLGWRLLVVNSHPGNEPILLSVNRLFVAELRHRILAPLEISKSEVGVPSDGAIFGFVALSLLERLNRCLKFPVQFSLARGESKLTKDSAPGMLVSIPIRVGDLTTEVRLFLPLQLLERCKLDRSSEQAIQYPDAVSWAFPISSSFVDLSSDELEQVGPGDILVTENRFQVLYPNDFGKGWFLSGDSSNTSAFRIDKYFERSMPVEAVEAAESTATKPDLASLPVRLHVIVGEKEFTAAEISSLRPGTIVEFHHEKVDPVRLMVNGKILGEGELVEVDGKLAVKVLGWRKSPT